VLAGYCLPGTSESRPNLVSHFLPHFGWHHDVPGWSEITQRRVHVPVSLKQCNGYSLISVCCTKDEQKIHVYGGICTRDGVV